MSKMWLLGYGMGRTYEVGRAWGDKFPREPEFDTPAEQSEFWAGFDTGRADVDRFMFGEAA
jgi:hypothetical protein